MGPVREAGLYNHHQINTEESKKRVDGMLKFNDCRHGKCKWAALISNDVTLKDAKISDLLQTALQPTLTFISD